MDSAKEYLTKEKYEELQKELEYLKTVKRREVAENLEYAKSLGDLSENAEYHEARDMQASVEDRIVKLENLLKSAEIVASRHTEKAMAGSTVVLQKEGGSEVTYNIVGSEEADMAQKKLSVSSPLGSAMLGKKKGDSFQVETPGGTIKYTIVEIK
jgi:transcription elongation factor GreA